MQGSRWDWIDAGGAERVREEIDRVGFSWIHVPDLVAHLRAPDELIFRLLGRYPLNYRSQPIEVGAGPGWPGGAMEAALHTDTLGIGLPPQLLVMACERPADVGGETIFVDPWPALAQVEAEDPELFRELFETPIKLEYGAQPWFGSYFSWRMGHLLCVWAKRTRDPIGQRFGEYLQRQPETRLRMEAGDVVLVNNYRVLHGRTGFEDARRKLVRILAWIGHPFPAPARPLARARAVAMEWKERLRDQPDWVHDYLGLVEVDPVAIERLERTLIERNIGVRDTVAPRADNYWDLWRWQGVVVTSLLRTFAQSQLSREDQNPLLERILEHLRPRKR